MQAHEPEAALEVEQLDLLLHCRCGEIARIGVLSLGVDVTCPRCARTWVVRVLLGTVQELTGAIEGMRITP